MGDTANEELHRPTFKANATSTGAATDAEVVAAVTGMKIKVKKLLFTTSTAATFLLESGSSTTILGPTTALNSFSVDGLKAADTAAGEALRYTTNTGNSWVYVEYQLSSQ